MKLLKKITYIVVLTCLLSACAESDIEPNNVVITPTPTEDVENNADVNTTISFEKEVFAESKDNNYTLYYGEGKGGTQTEILQREVLFYNKLTNEYKSLGFTDVGNSIDSVNEEWGFFQNGDIYHFNFDRFDIYEKGLENDTPKFKLTDKLSLGEVNDENITARYLHAIRRDPNDGTFIAIFSEVPRSLGVNIYTDKSETVMKTNYVIGFITKDGMLTDQLDTSCPVLCRNNGYYSYFANVNMYVNDQQLDMEVTDRISGEVFTKGFWMFDTEQFIVQQAYMGKERIINDFHEPVAVSDDGKYSLYKVFSDYYQQSAILLNNFTNETINLGECDYAGFLSDGTIYLQTSKDYKIVNIHGASLFKLSDNFRVIKEKGQTVHINNVCRRDDGSFVIVWFETVSEHNVTDDANYQAQYAVYPFLQTDTYKVSLTDAEGNLISTVNTSKYAETNKHINVSTPIEIVDSNSIVFYSAVNDSKQFEVTVDFAAGESVIKDYREETAHSEFDVLLAAKNIDKAHFLYFHCFKSGDMAIGGEQLPKEKNPYPQTVYYAHKKDCDTVEELKKLACTYFSEEVFENSFMSEFESKYESTPPYLIEVDGIIYNNLNYGVGGKAIFMHETAEVTELKNNTAIVTMQYYNAIDETSKETTTVEMVYENDRWVFNQAFLLKKYE